jgi:tetratricopeptide (TPR) repeat protein
MTNALRRVCVDKFPRSPVLWIAWSGLLLLITSSGCILGNQSPGVRLLNQGDYTGAIDALRSEEIADPADPSIKRDLGVALYLAGENEAARGSLAAAREMKADDVQAVFYLGRVLDELNDIDGALEAYAAYLGMGGKGEAEVQARLVALRKEKTTHEIRQTIAAEQSLSIESVPSNAIAVPTFINLTNTESLAPLARGLAVVLMTDLGVVDRLRVLERQRLSVLLAELNLAHGEAAVATIQVAQPDTSGWRSILNREGVKDRLHALIQPATGRPYYHGEMGNEASEAYIASLKGFQADHGLVADGLIGPASRAGITAALKEQWRFPTMATSRPGIINPESAPRLGSLLGARRFVQGSFIPLSDTEIQLSADLYEIERTRETSSVPPVSGALEEILYLENQLVYLILDDLGIEPTAAERELIDQVPTEDFEAFLAFCRGLEYEELGLPGQAASAYGEAVRLDPAFNEAVHQEKINSTSETDQDALDRTEVVRSNDSPEERQERLNNTGELIGLGPVPESDNQDGQTNSNTDVSRITNPNETTVTIIIRPRPPGSKR